MSLAGREPRAPQRQTVAFAVLSTADHGGLSLTKIQGGVAKKRCFLKISSSQIYLHFPGKERLRMEAGLAACALGWAVAAG